MKHTLKFVYFRKTDFIDIIPPTYGFPFMCLSIYHHLLQNCNGGGPEDLQRMKSVIFWGILSIKIVLGKNERFELKIGLSGVFPLPYYMQLVLLAFFMFPKRRLGTYRFYSVSYYYHNFFLLSFLLSASVLIKLLCYICMKARACMSVRVMCMKKNN